MRILRLVLRRNITVLNKIKKFLHSIFSVALYTHMINKKIYIHTLEFCRPGKNCGRIARHYFVVSTAIYFQRQILYRS